MAFTVKANAWFGLLLYPEISYADYAANLEDRMRFPGYAVPIELYPAEMQTALRKLTVEELKPWIQNSFIARTTFRIPMTYPDGRIVPGKIRNVGSKDWKDVSPSDRENAVWAIPITRTGVVAAVTAAVPKGYRGPMVVPAALVAIDHWYHYGISKLGSNGLDVVGAISKINETFW